MDSTRDEYCFEKCSFIKFMLLFGLKNVPKEVARILGRSCKEMSYNHTTIVKSQRGVKKQEVIGYGIIRKIPPKYTFADKGDSIIGPYYVRADFRNHGIGTKLLFALESVARSNGYKKIYAYVLTQNIGSCKAFSKAGYEMVGYMDKREGAYFIADKGAFCVFCKSLTEQNHAT